AHSCHGMGSDHGPSKQKSDGDVECCKVLRATLNGSVNFASYDAWAFTLQLLFVSPGPLLEPVRSALPLELDTGPPGGSFAETVLQRSILAHAPPSLA
ncbi:MAG TPA: hypothetical protein VIL63_00015, partial [Terriglobales bacterium]